MYGGENMCVKGYGVETWRKKPHGRLRHRWYDNGAQIPGTR